MDNTKPTRPYGGKILCANGHLVGMMDDERCVIKVRHHGREMVVSCVPGTGVEFTCEKCMSRVLITFGPDEGAKRNKFNQTRLHCGKFQLD